MSAKSRMGDRSRFLRILIPVLVMLLPGESGNSGGAPPLVAAGTGQIYVVAGSAIVRVKDMTGAGRTTLSEISSWGIFVDRAGRIYLADWNNKRIVRVDDMTGAGWTTLATAGQPSAIFLDEANRIYITEWGPNNSGIVRMNNMTGVGWTALESWGGGVNQFREPSGIFVDGADRIYVADRSNHRIVRINDMTGAGWTTVGTCPQNPCNGVNQFDAPEAIFVDRAGRIYVADASNKRVVRMNDMTGTGWMTLGTYGAGVNQFSTPWGISVDGAGRIYVADATSMFEGRIVRMNDITGAGWTTLNLAGSPRGIFIR